jgi:hypothetical protein
MIHRRARLLGTLAGIAIVLTLAGCSSAATNLLQSAASSVPSAPIPTATGPTLAPSETPASVARGGTPSGPGKQPGTIVCGPQTASQASAICVAPADEPYVAAAEKLLSPDELAAATGARVSQGAAMCAALPAAECTTNPPTALVTFERASAGPIEVIVRRDASGQLQASRA